MIQSQLNEGKPLVKYTIKIEAVADMEGYVVEIIDKINFRNYTLNNIYLDKVKAMKEGNVFVNNLFEEEDMLTIN